MIHNRNCDVTLVIPVHGASDVPHRFSSSPSGLQAKIESEPDPAHLRLEILSIFSRHTLVKANRSGFDDSDDMGGPIPPKGSTVPLPHPH